MKVRRRSDRRRKHLAAAIALQLLCPLGALAGGVHTLGPVEVSGSGLVGAADSATEGTVLPKQIVTRPWLRPGDVLETVPGLIVTQHTGDGKANQFFLRGFNLDHGTDFATYVLGMPVNLPTHAHGQGYTDLNFLIPELIGGVRYRKGPYSIQQGDFAAAGSARLDYVRQLAAPFGEVSLGENGFRRLLAAASPPVADGHLLLAAEDYRNDGPWDLPQDYRKRNAVLRYAHGTEGDGWDLALLAYDARWTASDQVPLRAIDSGALGRFGTIDPSNGGDTERSSLSWQWADRDRGWRAHAYAVRYRLDLFSNFTYFLDNPTDGDQFEQVDRRSVLGTSLERGFATEVAGRPLGLTLGATLRQDDIDRVGLHLTRARARLATIREDAVMQRAAGAYAEAKLVWTDWLRTVTGMRADHLRVDVGSDTPANSGARSDTLVTPKFTAVLGPWARSELYASYGEGFHSNDARGATIRVNPDPRDPEFGNAAERVPLLVRARGSELGLRSAPSRAWQAALALWRLELGSELVFIGDAGSTEASRPSLRQGIEMSHYFTPLAGLTIDLDLSLSRARFRDRAPEGDRIPGAIERTAGLGIAFDRQGAWYGGLRLRHFGPRALIEDNSVRSASSTLVNARLGWRTSRRLEVVADVINLFDRAANDIEYFYESRLRGEVSPVADRHLHPTEPRTLRLTLRYAFE